MIDRGPGNPGRQHIHHRRWFANQEESRPQEMNSFAFDLPAIIRVIRGQMTASIQSSDCGSRSSLSNDCWRLARRAGVSSLRLGRFGGTGCLDAFQESIRWLIIRILRDQFPWLNRKILDAA